MYKLIIKSESHLDLALEDAWDTDHQSWTQYVRSLPDVVAATWDGEITTITFESEELKNWFVLKYS
jgi:hypothetical protein